MMKIPRLVWFCCPAEISTPSESCRSTAVQTRPCHQSREHRIQRTWHPLGSVILCSRFRESGGPGDLGLVGLTGVFAPHIPIDVDLSQQEWMVTECQQVIAVRSRGQAALDRPLVVVSQNSHPPVAEVTSRAQHQKVSQRLSRHRLSMPIQQVSAMAHGKHLVPSAEVHSRWVSSTSQRPLEACSSSSPQLATESIPCQRWLQPTNSYPLSIFEPIAREIHQPCFQQCVRQSESPFPTKNRMQTTFGFPENGHLAFGPKSTLQTVAQVECMCEPDLVNTALSQCLHEYETCCTSTLRDATPMPTSVSSEETQIQSFTHVFQVDTRHSRHLLRGAFSGSVGLV